MRSRHGFSLVEMLIVVVLLGLVILIGYPKMRTGLVKNDVRAARTTVINLFSLARTTAVQSNRSTWLIFNGNSAYVIRQQLGGGAVDTVGTVENLGTSYQVTLAVPTDADTIQFSPSGLGAGFNTAGSTILLTRSGYSDSITVDGFGRVKK